MRRRRSLLGTQQEDDVTELLRLEDATEVFVEGAAGVVGQLIGTDRDIWVWVSSCECGC